jgi:hypothetical protein
MKQALLKTEGIDLSEKGRVETEKVFY